MQIDMFQRCPSCRHRLTWYIRPSITGAEARVKCPCGYSAVRLYKKGKPTS